MPPDTATQAREQSKEVASQATEQSKEVAGTAKEQATAVAHEAASEVGHVASEARGQATRLVDDTKQQLHGQAGAQTDKVAESLERLHGQARALLAGNSEDAGPLVDYAEEAVAKLGDLASHVRTRGFDGLIEDTQRFARRRPGVFLASAAAAGFLAGRAVRSTKDEQQQQQPDTSPPQPGAAHVSPEAAVDVREEVS
jgi:ElaB/YqjD/DUF883 family membrane-anchored ribosome-binding protein